MISFRKALLYLSSPRLINLLTDLSETERNAAVSLMVKNPKGILSLFMVDALIASVA